MQAIEQIERAFSLKFKPGIGYQWRFDDGEEVSPIFDTKDEAQIWIEGQLGYQCKS